MTTMAEPEWDQQTRDTVLALDAIPTCSSCGRPTSICHDPDNADLWEAGDASRCHATTALRNKQKQYNEQDNEHMDALSWSVRLREHE